jgi:hypothetical protein
MAVGWALAQHEIFCWAEAQPTSLYAVLFNGTVLGVLVGWVALGGMVTLQLNKQNKKNSRNLHAKIASVVKLTLSGGMCL